MRYPGRGQVARPIYRHSARRHPAYRAAYAGRERSEAIVARFGLTRERRPIRRTRCSSTSDLPWPTDEAVRRHDGACSTRPRTPSTARVQNRADRKLVMDSFFGAMKQFEQTFGSTLYSSMKTDSVNAKVHRYPDVITAAPRSATSMPGRGLRHARCPRPTPTSARCSVIFACARSSSASTDMHYYDIYPPLVKEDVKYSLDDAKPPHPRGRRAARSRLCRRHEERLRSSLDGRVPAAAQAVGRAHEPGGIRRAPLRARQLQRRLRGRDDRGARVGPRDCTTVLAEKAQPFTTANYSDLRRRDRVDLQRGVAAEAHARRLEDRRRTPALSRLGAREPARHVLPAGDVRGVRARRCTPEVDAGREPVGRRHDEDLRRDLEEVSRATRSPSTTSTTIEWAYIPHFYGAFYVFQYATSIAASSLLRRHRAQPRSRARGNGTSACCRPAGRGIRTSSSKKPAWTWRRRHPIARSSRA